MSGRDGEGGWGVEMVRGRALGSGDNRGRKGRGGRLGRAGERRGRPRTGRGLLGREVGMERGRGESEREVWVNKGRGLGADLVWVGNGVGEEGWGGERDHGGRLG